MYLWQQFLAKRPCKASAALRHTIANAIASWFGPCKQSCACSLQSSEHMCSAVFIWHFANQDFISK